MNEIRRILVPTDFSDGAFAALDYAVFLASRFGASLEAIHVVEPGRSRESAEVEMKRHLAKLSGRSLDVRTRIEAGDARFKVPEIAATEGHDMIVMGTHGRTGVDRALIGSVAEAVVRRAPCPVLTVRIRSAAGALAGRESRAGDVV